MLPNGLSRKNNSNNQKMMHATDEIPPAVETCGSLDSIDMCDVDLGSSECITNASVDRIPSPAATMTSSSSASTTGTRSICGTPSSTPPRAMMNTSQREQRSASLVNRMVPPPTMTAASVDTSSHVSYGKNGLVPATIYNTIAPTPSLENASSADSTIGDYDAANMKEKEQPADENRGVYRFKVRAPSTSPLLTKVEIAGSGRKNYDQSPSSSTAGDAATAADLAGAVGMEEVEPMCRVSPIATTISREKEGDEAITDRGIYRFKVQLDASHFEKKWWQW